MRPFTRPLLGLFLTFTLTWSACSSGTPEVTSSGNDKIPVAAEEELLKLFDVYQLNVEAHLNQPELYTFIYYSLLYTGETYSHNLGGVTTNQVFFNEDGREAVYDADGNSVEDCTNKGSYNYYLYNKDPFLHFVYDSYPWIIWGGCETDTSTVEERVEAYARDFLNGASIFKPHWDEVEAMDPVLVTDKGDVVALNLFIKIFQTDELSNYKYDGTDPWVTDESAFELFSTQVKEIMLQVLVE